MTLEQLYTNHKNDIAAIYLTGSQSLGLDSTHDIDYAIYFNSRDAYTKAQGDIEYFCREFDKRPGAFIHYVDEVHEPKFWSYQLQYWKLLHGNEIPNLYNVLEHKDECIALLKRIAWKAQGKSWYHIYLFAKVLSNDSYDLSDEDYKIIVDIRNNGITDKRRAAILNMVDSL